MRGMRRLIARSLVACATAGLVVACGVSPATPGPVGVETMPANATPVRDEPVVECLGGLDAATCAKALPVVIDAVAGSGWTPVHVWINSGMLAPEVGMLFDPHANFPAQRLPDGGSPAGNAEISFAETDSHAGLNLVAIGDRITADLIGYAVPHADWCSGTCPSARTIDGPFTLDLVLPRLEWRTGEPLLGSAILSYAGPERAEVSGSSRLVAFRFAEVGGTRVIEPAWPADCTRQVVDPATPLNQALGADVGLPAGTWDVTAIARFSEGGICLGIPYDIAATLRVTVRD